jgi:hypothetical protein
MRKTVNFMEEFKEEYEYAKAYPNFSRLVCTLIREHMHRNDLRDVIRQIVTEELDKRDRGVNKLDKLKGLL